MDLLNQVAENLRAGESRLIPCEDKIQQKNLVKALRSEIKILAAISPTAGSKLRAFGAFKDSRFWAVVEKTATNPLISYILDKDGNISRTRLSDPERSRRLFLMAKDGVSLKEVQELEGPLTDDEIADFREVVDIDTGRKEDSCV